MKLDVILLNIIQMIAVKCNEFSHLNYDETLMEPYQYNIPTHCRGPPPEMNPYECCPVPPSYSEKEFSACNVTELPDPSPRTIGPTNCTKTMCLMRNSNQLNIDGSINYKKVYKHLEKWAKENPDFEAAILIAREKCINGNRPPFGPLEVCDADKIFFCLTAYIMWNCKLRENIPECLDFKVFLRDCQHYYIIS